MKVIDLKQNTPEWLKSRAYVIGGSDIEIIMSGRSSYDKNYIREKLITEKAYWRNIFEDDPEAKPPLNKSRGVMAIGHWVEDFTRPKFELIMGRDFPPVCGRHDKYPFMQVSFDGLASNMDVWECKYTGKTNVLNSRSLKILNKFIYQTQYQLLVSGGETVYLHLTALDRSRKKIVDENIVKFKADKECHKKMIEVCLWTEEQIEKKRKVLREEK